MAKHFDLAECKLLTKILIASDFTVESICEFFNANYDDRDQYFNWVTVNFGKMDDVKLYVVPCDCDSSSDTRAIIWEGVIPH